MKPESRGNEVCGKSPVLLKRTFSDWVPGLLGIKSPGVRGRILALVYWDYLCLFKNEELAKVHALRAMYPYSPGAGCSDREVYRHLLELGYTKRGARIRASGAGTRGRQVTRKLVVPADETRRIKGCVEEYKLCAGEAGDE